MIPISYVSLTKPLWDAEQGEFSKADDRRNAAEGLHKRSKAFAQSVQHICTKCAPHLHKVCTTLAQVAPHGCTKSARHPYSLYYIKFLFETSKT
jgi:hypothetical protein